MADEWGHCWFNRFSRDHLSELGGSIGMNSANAPRIKQSYRTGQGLVRGVFLTDWGGRGGESQPE